MDEEILFEGFTTPYLSKIGFFEDMGYGLYFNPNFIIGIKKKSSLLTWTPAILATTTRKALYESPKIEKMKLTRKQIDESDFIIPLKDLQEIKIKKPVKKIGIIPGRVVFISRVAKKNEIDVNNEVFTKINFLMQKYYPDKCKYEE